MEVTNIIISNDVTNFGLVERRDTAHCGYGWNPFVIGTIVNGYGEGGAVRGIDLRLRTIAAWNLSAAMCGEYRPTSS